MITENQFSENEENAATPEETNSTEKNSPENEELNDSSQESAPVSEASSTEEQSSTQEVEESTSVNQPEEAELTEEHEEILQNHEEQKTAASLPLPELLNELEKIVNSEDAGAHFKKFHQLKDAANHIISYETEEKKHENAEYVHPSSSKLNALNQIFKEKHDNFLKNQEEDHKENLEKRQAIIEKLKNLYTNTEPGTNLFKAIREIKEQWQNAGQVAKSDFKLLNNNYFHHLNQFYQMLDMNQEYLHQEFAHNLEKRQHIIERAKELENEPVVQKALNELQYLHKLWKEEAEPVAEEFREKTWQEFKEISNRIHERKTELISQIEETQNENLEKKNKIIQEIKLLSEPEKEPNHNYWQNSIKKVEVLRDDFLKLGNVPKKLSSQNWNEFKEALRKFNTTKNDFYKNLKGSQQANLEEKLKLIQTAKDNMLSEDWETATPLFKKLQEDWKKIGHVPRSMTNKVWDEFREACNTFFNNYREKNNAVTDNWKENYKQKKELLDELKTITNEEGSVEKIENIKTSWNAIGKVPRDKMSINSEFNKTLREKLKINKINEFDLKEENLSEGQITDKARKLKSQIADLEAEIVNMENNLGFFGNASRENPLLAETYKNIDQKKANLEHLKQSLHNIISGE